MQEQISSNIQMTRWRVEKIIQVGGNIQIRVFQAQRGQVERAWEDREREQERECPDFCTIITPVHPLRPNIWGRTTDGPLFAPHRSNVLPAPAPMSINGRHVPKHIQHTKRTLWLEEMDCAQDWQEALWMRQSPKALCFTPVASFKNKDAAFCFSRLCMQYKLFHIWLQEKNARHEEKKEKSLDLSHKQDYCPTGKCEIQGAQLCTACFCESPNLHVSWYDDGESRMKGGRRGWT